VGGQWVAVLNKLTRAFNKCSTPKFGESGQSYREPQQKNVSKKAIQGRYMWSFFMVIDPAASEASEKVKSSTEANATGADLSAGGLI
jgi:hypothetical protein